MLKHYLLFFLIVIDLDYVAAILSENCRGALLPSCYTNRIILQAQKVFLQPKNSEYKLNHWLAM
jgi:hypothetical protein